MTRIFSPRNSTQEKSGKMAKFRNLALFAVLMSTVSFSFAAAGSILTVEGGVYSRVTARIDADAVPRPHCRRAIKNLQVSTKQQRHSDSVFGFTAITKFKAM